MGDAYAGLTFVNDFSSHGISYYVSELTKSELYEAMEPPLNCGEVILLDEPQLESQLLGLVWRNSKIDHMPGEHDDFANSVAGAIYLASTGCTDFELITAGSRVITDESLFEDGPFISSRYGSRPWE
jgi:hypothetical protein